MSFLFHEPFDPAPYVRRRFARPSTAAIAVPSFNPARRRLADALFEDESPLQPRRSRQLGVATAPPVSPVFSPARRIMASLAAFAEDPWSDPPRPFGGAGYTPPDGTSASFTISVTGGGDDPYGDEAVGAGVIAALAADPSQALATQRLADFTGVSAARVG